jgi:prepilin peptidase CpaA
MNLELMIFISIFLIFVIYNDIKWRIIPNSMTFFLIIFGFIYNLLSNGTAGLISAFSGFLVGTGFFFIFFFIGGMGAGDVKLMGGIGAVLGFKNVLMALFLTAFAGGIISLMAISAYYINRKTKLSDRFIFLDLKDKNPLKITLPYSIAIGAGTILSFFIQS